MPKGKPLAPENKGRVLVSRQEAARMISLYDERIAKPRDRRLLWCIIIGAGGAIIVSVLGMVL